MAEMKRLTYYYMKGSENDGWYLKPGVTREKALWRLATYENTGLTPEQIKNAKETLECFDNIGIKRGSEIVRAEREGRLVILDEPRLPLVWGDEDHDTILCPNCKRDLMGGFELADADGPEMVQCPHCGQPVDVMKALEGGTQP